MHSRLIENKYREGKVKRTLKRELKVPEISGSEADGTGFLRLDCCAQGTPYLHFACVVELRRAMFLAAVTSALLR